MFLLLLFVAAVTYFAKALSLAMRGESLLGRFVKAAVEMGYTLIGSGIQKLIGAGRDIDPHAFSHMRM
jgi:hypothetical protein